MVNLKQITAWICEGCKRVLIDEDDAATHICEREQVQTEVKKPVIEHIVLGDIQIWLPKNDANMIVLAKKSLDLYKEHILDAHVSVSSV